MATAGKKRVPLRTCVTCRTAGAKRGLLRVVREPDGTVRYDPSGKANGRGAYVCAERACIEAAGRQRRLARSLKTDVPADTVAALLAAADARQAALPDREDGAPA